MPRRCSVCDHPDRLAIETLLLENAPLRDIARQFSLSKDAVARHKESHVTARLASAHAAQEATDAGTIMDRLRALNAEVRSLLSEAKQAHNHELTLKVLARAESQLALEAKLLSEQPVIDRQVAELLQIKMTEALLRLRSELANEPALMRRIFDIFIGGEPAGLEARRQLPN